MRIDDFLESDVMLAAGELEQLQYADRLLRSVPAPDSPFLRAVARPPRQPARSFGFRFRLTAAAASAVAALAFGVTQWQSGSGAYETVRLSAPSGAPNASGTIRVGRLDPATGNFELAIDVEGLPPVGHGDYYVLWLRRDGGEFGVCGTFNVREGGSTRIVMNASYQLEDYESWVISSDHPSEPIDERPALLEAEIS
ncbi:MAG TPA: anti-sigma factor [Gaiellaceae bacterium]|nr:anti-sigma factor [Gaiellaceae bacterium]